MTIAKGADGFYHPSTDVEVAELIKHAHGTDTHVRVCGAQMSLRASVHGDGFDGDGVPPANTIEIKLDKLIALTWIDDQSEVGELWVESGCLLGPAYTDRTGESWKTSLTYQLEQKGYALDQMSGVSHQSLAGFLMTGSAGGSVKHAIHDNILALELIDGEGTKHTFERSSSDPKNRDGFFAAGVSMGLLGVLVRVRLTVGQSYAIDGAEDITTFEDTVCDLDGDGDNGTPSFADYLKSKDYARALWWPQNDFDRVQMWHCNRVTPGPDFERKPFEVLSRRDALLGSLVYTIIGNLDDMSVVPEKLKDWYAEVERVFDDDEQDVDCPLPSRTPVSRADIMGELRGGLRRTLTKHPDIQEGAEDHDDDVRALVAKHGGRENDDNDFYDWIARLLVKVVDGMVDGLSGVIIAKLLKRILPGYIDELLGMFMKMGSRDFRDSWMCGLPMDNGMSAALWHTEFTELWVPLDKAATAVKLLHDYFNHNDKKEAYRRTGPYAVELYSGPASEFWMSPGYGAACMRVNVFWFAKWAGSPRDSMYPPIWERLKELDMRVHWGKHLPDPSDAWRAHYRTVYPKLDDFLTLRAELDPKNIFLTSYWKGHLGVP